jgi:hypothetical protein
MRNLLAIGCTLAAFFISSSIIAQTLYVPGGTGGIGASGNGNVGIGTNNPSTKLDIRSVGIIGLSVSGNTSSYLGSDISISRSSTTEEVGKGATLQFNDTGSGSHNVIQNSSGGLQFYNYYSNSGWIERMRIASNGNVGIGTTTPFDKLSVVGKQGLGIPGSSSGQLSFYPNNGSSWFHIDHRNDNTLRFSQGGTVGGTDIMTIVNNGNVGIGTTAPGRTLDVAGVISNGGGEFILGNRDGRNQGSIIHNRALVHSDWGIGNDNLVINYEGDFEGGISLQGSKVVIDGNVGIGTTTPGSFKLAVEGKIWAKEVQVALTNPGPDYVFEPTYNLKPLSEIETYIKANKHLPEVPSAKEMEANGVQLGEMNMLLLKKVEELTLYVIELKKENERQNEIINGLQRK